jgi:hypothetical protein
MTARTSRGQGRCDREVPSTPYRAPCTGTRQPTRSTPREACRQGSAYRVFWGHGRRDTVGTTRVARLVTWPSVQAAALLEAQYELE